MRRTVVRRLIPVDRARIYATILDPALLPEWKVPEGMTLTVHEYEPREGGRLRISLTYVDTSSPGKSAAHTDTYHGRFVQLVPNELIVEDDEFETTDPARSGRMTITIRLSDRAGGTELVATHAPVPKGVPLDENEVGWNMALEKLTALVARIPA